MLNLYTVDDVEDDEENGHSSANHSQGDQDAAQKILADSSALAATDAFGVTASVLRHRLDRNGVQLLRTLCRFKNYIYNVN